MVSPIITWVVDAKASAILCWDGKPAELSFAKSLIDTLPTHSVATIYPEKILHAKLTALPSQLVSLSTLIHHSLIKTKDQNTYQYNGKLYQLIPYRQLVSCLPTTTIHQISHAIQLLRWRDDHRFCSRCGTPTFVHPDEYASTCPNCQHRSYPRISPCVITAVTRVCDTTGKPQILLALHHRHKDGMHGLIAGFVEIGESLEQAVARETLEETGILVKNIRYLTSQPWPYPSNLMVGFVAEFDGGEICADTSELVYAKFFDLDDLPKIPNHGTIARTLIEQVQLDFKANL